MTSIYKGANAVILLVDLTNAESFGSISDWLSEIRSYAPKAPVYLVGTKSDSPAVSFLEEECHLMAESHGLTYSQVSSKTGENVDALFIKIVGDLKERTMEARDEKERYSHSYDVKDRDRKRKIAEKAARDLEEGVGKSSCCCTVM
jgi:GTPase SAR1 family protein